MMNDRRICIACLSRDTKMGSILNTHLPEFYERLTNNNLSEYKLPKTICYICYSQLQKCYKFMEMSQKAGKILTELHSDVSIQINQETEALKLKSTNNFVKTILNPIFVPPSCDDEEAFQTFSDHKIINVIHGEIQGTKEKLISTYKQELNEIDVQLHIEEEPVTIKEEFMSVEIDPSTNAQVNKTYASNKTETTDDVKSIQHHLEGKHNMYVPEATMVIEESSEAPKLRKKNKSFYKDRNHVCIRCGKAFTHGYYLQRHMVTHTGEKRFACKTCDKKFTQNAHLVQHMRLHTGEKLLVCEVCCKTFSHRYNFKIHMQRHCKPENLLSSPTQEKSHKCDLCSSAFYNKGDLNRHVRSHTGEKPFICDYCDAKFSQKGHLRDHIRTHTDEKPFVCNFCKVAFTQKWYLNNHIAEHTGGRLYPCNFPGCHKSFQTKTTIANHMRVHTGERPFSCDKCDKTYKQRGHLTTHIGAVHAKEEIENDLLAATNQL